MEGEGGGGEGHTYGYKLEQSTSQESVMSLEALMDGEDSVTLDHCSMFIDVVGMIDMQWDIMYFDGQESDDRFHFYYYYTITISLLFAIVPYPLFQC